MAINRRTRFRIFVRDDFTCQYCGVKAPDTELQVDHRFPVSRGGLDDESNLVTACIACNGGKLADVVPIALKINDGPLHGQFIKVTAFDPILWVWRDPDGQLVSLHDERLRTRADGSGPWYLKFGPSWANHERPDSARLLPRMRYRQDGASSELLGGYVASDFYPFETYAGLDWMEPWQLLCHFDEALTGRASRG